jgi:AcrR family transcriptional regulator
MDDQQRIQPRRTPRQVRGQQRVAAILDSAEELFGAIGYDTATTNQIAGQAGIPIGSVYQFFPNKAAILHAVAERYRTQFYQRYAESFSAPGESLSANAAQLVHAMVEFGTEHKGFTRLILFAGGEPEVLAAATLALQEMVIYLEQMIAQAHPELATERRKLVPQTGIVATKAVLGAALRDYEQHEAQAYAMVTEAQVLLVSYLERSVK